ncbi:hypothetical protein HAX54_021911 [Datura stramonium]|uniref:Uncharacterized protein n=1 Tax=Datura stramonium TaxID=4076 RepID=A0ABS8S3R6_DATST|nr:hypothetical protein [Datura stramonium]
MSQIANSSHSKVVVAPLPVRSSMLSCTRHRPAFIEPPHFRGDNLEHADHATSAESGPPTASSRQCSQLSTEQSHCKDPTPHRVPYLSFEWNFPPSVGPNRPPFEQATESTYEFLQSHIVVPQTN